MIKKILLLISSGMAFLYCRGQQPSPTLDVAAVSPDHNWNGVAVSNDNRLFADFPRFDSSSNPSLVEIINGQLVPFPGNEWNYWSPGKDPQTHFVTINSIFLNRSDNHLWIIDSGDPFMGKHVKNAPKLVEIDLKTNQAINVYPFGEMYAPQGSHLNDIRIVGDDVIVTESGLGKFLVLNRKTGKIRQLLSSSKYTKMSPSSNVYINGYRLQGVDAKTPVTNVDQLELSPDQKMLYFMAPFDTILYRIPVAAILNASLTDAELESLVQIDRKVVPVGGIIMDKKGDLYLSSIREPKILCQGVDKKVKWVLTDSRLIWPDAYSIAPDGTFYVAVAQISSMPFMRGGKDLRKPPYYIFKFKP